MSTTRRHGSDLSIRDLCTQYRIAMDVEDYDHAEGAALELLARARRQQGGQS